MRWTVDLCHVNGAVPMDAFNIMLDRYGGLFVFSFQYILANSTLLLEVFYYRV